MSISLKIKGNKFSNEGVGVDHVCIGESSFFVLDRQYSLVNRAGYGIVIRHYADKSVYTITIASVSSVDGIRQGSLYISVCIPKGERVHGLYNLLIQLAEFYRTNYMTVANNGYRFTNKKENPDEFQNILNNYPVSHYPYRHIASSDNVDSVAYICAPVNDIASILEDPMRPEFAQYGQIVLIPNGNPTDATLTIPAILHRPYTLIVNGKKIATTVSDPDKMMNISVPETKLLYAGNVRFSINQARHTNIAGASVTIDDYDQTLTINVHQQRKPLPEPKQESTARKSHKRTFFILSAIAILIAAAAAFIFFQMDSDEPDAITDIKTADQPNDTIPDTANYLNPDDKDAIEQFNQQVNEGGLQNAELPVTKDDFKCAEWEKTLTLEKPLTYSTLKTISQEIKKQTEGNKELSPNQQEIVALLRIHEQIKTIVDSYPKNPTAWTKANKKEAAQKIATLANSETTPKRLSDILLTWDSAKIVDAFTRYNANKNQSDIPLYETL